MKSLLAWLDDRLGWRAARGILLDEGIPGGARFAYVFGSGLLLLMALQFLTGLVLACFYAPSVRTAWESVWFIEEQVWLGSLLRGMHHHGASVFMVLLLLHMLQVVIYGAYRRPREVTWLLGLLLSQVVLAFALTGYLLPWDERGFGATKVATGILAITPGAGAALERLALGGSDYGQLTLTRFYAIHVLVLPAALVGLVALHLWSMRRHGVLAAPGLSDEKAAQEEPFWPGQALRDVLLAGLLIALLYGLARHFPAPLTAPADPSSDFPARPEWYFLPLFQLLKLELFQGSREVIGSHFLPGAIGLFLAALPFLDRSKERGTKSRRWIFGCLAALFLGALLLAMSAVVQDAGDLSYKNKSILAEERAGEARRLARRGIPPTGALTMLRRSAYAGASIFRARCAGCHRGERRKAPALEGYLHRDWVAGLILDPNHDRYFGRTKLGKEEGMEANPKLSFEQRRQLADFLLRQGEKSSRKAGATLFAAQDCGDCHELKQDLACTGPNLFDYGSRDWLTRLVKRPGGFLHYGENSTMPAFGGELSEDEVAAVVSDLMGFRKTRPAPPPPSPPKKPSKAKPKASRGERGRGGRRGDSSPRRR